MTGWQEGRRTSKWHSSGWSLGTAIIIFRWNREARTGGPCHLRNANLDVLVLAGLQHDVGRIVEKRF